MRHGQAETFGNTDASRPLTEQGKLEAIVMANVLKNKQVEFDQVFVKSGELLFGHESLRMRRKLFVCEYKPWIRDYCQSPVIVKGPLPVLS